MARGVCRTRRAVVGPLQRLFDYFDDRQTGGDDQRFAWMEGRPSDRSNEWMRTKLPELYEVMSAQRNEWWARTIIRSWTERTPHSSRSVRITSLGRRAFLSCCQNRDGSSQES